MMPVSPPTGAEILHESEGLLIWRNPKNKFCVVNLHHTADPNKRSQEWRAEAAAGMHPAKVRQEYDMDDEAMFGEKVFPEILNWEDRIVVKPPYPEFGESQLYWGGFDFGQNNPSSLHVYTVADGVLYSVWELFEPCKNSQDFAKKIKACPYWHRMRYIAADPHLWDNRSHSMKDGSLQSVYDEFCRLGVSKFIKGNPDEAVWVGVMHKHWADPENITFKIFDCCPNQIREFKGAVYPTMSERLLATQNYRETILDKNNHTMDDCKYFMNSRPTLERKEVKFPKMVSRWIK